MLSSYIPLNKLSSLEEAIDQNLLATFLLVSLLSTDFSTMDPSLI